MFTDYVQPNVQVAEKRLDANYFQTLPYLENFNKGKGTNLVTVVGVRRTLRWLFEEIQVAGRAARRRHRRHPQRRQQQRARPAAVAEGRPAQAEGPEQRPGHAQDIAENPKNLKFKELESALLPRVLDQVDLDLINTNYALEAKLNPAKDALVLEDRDSPYVNYLVARPDNKDSDALKLSAALTSPEVKAFIEKKYAGAVVPAF